MKSSRWYGLTYYFMNWNGVWLTVWHNYPGRGEVDAFRTLAPWGPP